MARTAVDMWWISSVAFLFLAFGARALGIWFSPKLRLPMITCNLLTGIIIGPYSLQLVGKAAIPYLKWVSQFGQSYNALSAGAELYLPDMKGSWTAIFAIAFSIIGITFPVAFGLSLALENNATVLSWGMKYSDTCQIGIALLFGIIMCARSPAAAIAIIQELKAKGFATNIYLGVTVFGDIIVFIIYAFLTSVGLAMCGGSFSSRSLGISIGGVFGAIGTGVFYGFVLIAILKFTNWNSQWASVFTGFLVIYGFDVMATKTAAILGTPLIFEGLLVCVFAGFVCSNFMTKFGVTQEARKKFIDNLRWCNPYIFIPFFTLSGVTLDVSVLARSFLFGFIVFLVRLACVIIGTFVGGLIAKVPLKQLKFQWMNLVTQAGVSLSLSQRVYQNFTDTWGVDFNTACVAEILISNVVGAFMARWSIVKLGEANVGAPAAAAKKDHPDVPVTSPSLVELGKISKLEDGLLETSTAPLVNSLHVYGASPLCVLFTKHVYMTGTRNIVVFDHSSPDPAQKDVLSTLNHVGFTFLPHVEDPERRVDMDAIGRVLPVDAPEVIVVDLDDSSANPQLVRILLDKYGGRSMIIAFAEDRAERRKCIEAGAWAVDIATANSEVLQQIIKLRGVPNARSALYSVTNSTSMSRLDSESSSIGASTAEGFVPQGHSSASDLAPIAPSQPSQTTTAPTQEKEGTIAEAAASS